MNKCFCSDGHAVSHETARQKYKQAKYKKFGGNPNQRCEGCGAPAQGCAHIIAQARCKTLLKTELIWHPDNFFPACYACNSAIENPKGKEWKKLQNIEKCLEFIQIHDPELYSKFVA